MGVGGVVGVVDGLGGVVGGAGKIRWRLKWRRLDV